MKDRLFALRVFTRVARLGSFSAGGRELAVPQPTVSRIIAQLEDELGAPLFTRTTRAVSLTDTGGDFLVRVEQILADLEDAEHALRGSGELQGVLRVGLSSSYAIRSIAPRLPEFMDAHPKLRVELITSDHRQDLIGEGVDVAMRFGPLADSTATARRVAVLPRAIFAAPVYLARMGTPKTPGDLAAHSVIFSPSRLGRAWRFVKNGKVTSVQIDGRLMVSANEVGLVAAIAGMGIISMTLAAGRAEMASGQLVRLLPDWDMDNIELHAVFPAGRAAKPAARAFVDFAMRGFAADQIVPPASL